MKIEAICDAVDLLLSFNDKRRKSMQFDLPLKKQRLKNMQDLTILSEQKHEYLFEMAALEDEIEADAETIENWDRLKREARDNLQHVVGLGVRQTVNPQVHALVQQLMQVRRAHADGTVKPLSLSYMAVACGLSEGTVSKLRSGTYPSSVFPPTVKRGRRAAKR